MGKPPWVEDASLIRWGDVGIFVELIDRRLPRSLA